MHREYRKWYSPNLERDMELLVFGHAGARVLLFPTRTARFFDYEDWGVIGALQSHIENGWLQVYCLDSIDQESFYCFWCHPSGRINRHLQYEQYVIDEVLPFSAQINPNSCVMSVGCSMGAYHAINIALRHPGLFSKAVGMSGRYDLTTPMGDFGDLLSGYFDDNVYYNMPSRYIPNLWEEDLLNRLRKLEIILAIGQEDAFLDNNLQLSRELAGRGVHHSLYIWEGEAHKARFWRQMVQHYL